MSMIANNIMDKLGNDYIQIKLHKILRRLIAWHFQYLRTILTSLLFSMLIRNLSMLQELYFLECIR